MGAVMVMVALAMAGNYDVKFQNKIAGSLPSFLVNPTEGLEDTAAAKTALEDVRGESAHGVGAVAASAPQPATNAAGHSDLPVLGTAPEFVDNQQWFNTPGGRPLTLRTLRGRVVLVDFWTYSCINCLRTLPYLTAWDKAYRKDGLTIVGVHSPEFPFEKEAGNVEEAIERNGIHYPVAQDNDLATWNAYGNQYWPAEYFIDAQGRVRYAHFGEGEYGKKEQIIRQLLAEAGRRVPGEETRVHAVAPSADRHHARDLPGGRPGRTLHQPDALSRKPRLHRSLLPARQRIRLPRTLADLARLGEGRRRLARPQLRRPAGLPGARLAGPQSHDAGSARRPPDPEQRRRAPTSTTAWSRSTRSASTTWSTCPGSSTTSSRWSPKRG